MKNSIVVCCLAVIVSSQLITRKAYAQKVEVDGGVGYSVVNMESWSGYKENSGTTKLYDWGNQTSFGSLQLLFPTKKSSIWVGGNVGYQYLFWYGYRTYTSSGSYSYYENDVSATRFLGVVRFELGKNFFDLGAGVFMFKKYTDFSALASFGHAFPLTDKVAIPLKLNLHVIMDSDAMVVPVTCSTGISYKVK